MSELLVWVIFFVFYLIFQLIGNKRRPRPKPLPHGETASDGMTPKPATLEDALREIQEALRERRSKEPEPAFTTPPEPHRLPPRATPPVRPPRAEPEFHSLERKNLEPAPPPRKAPVEAAFAHTRLTKTSPAPLQPLVSEHKPRLVRELANVWRSPEALRKAWLITEVLGEPAWRRRIRG
jgi:hypothetical protein